MRKPLLFIACFILGVLALGWLAWENKSRLAAHFISNHLHAPVTIQSLDIEQTQIDIANLWIGTPRHFRTSTSFSAETIEVDTNVKQILDDPLIIDKIDISNIFVGLEYLRNGETNWSYMLKTTSPSSKKGRDYLIRTLVLENLTVEVTQANGQKKRYPTIPRMEFYNISSETGFPVAEIEKAIFNLMMKNILDKFNLLKQLPIPSNSPLKVIPNLFGSRTTQAPLY